MIFIEADEDTPKEESAKLEIILKSIIPSTGKKLLHAALAVDKDTKPTTTFTSDAPKICAFYIGDALKKGDDVRGAWIAEDVGPPHRKTQRLTKQRSLPRHRQITAPSLSQNLQTGGRSKNTEWKFTIPEP